MGTRSWSREPETFPWHWQAMQVKFPWVAGEEAGMALSFPMWLSVPSWDRPHPCRRAEGHELNPGLRGERGAETRHSLCHWCACSSVPRFPHRYNDGFLLGCSDGGLMAATLLLPAARCATRPGIVLHKGSFFSLLFPSCAFPSLSQSWRAHQALPHPDTPAVPGIGAICQLWVPVPTFPAGRKEILKTSSLLGASIVLQRVQPSIPVGPAGIGAHCWEGEA